MMDVNLMGALNCTRAVVPLMKQRGGGKIVNQVSAGAFPPFSVYGVTKLALVGLTVGLAKNLGPFNINVNAIAPGNTRARPDRC
jgi:NAD(P)-dependent dehydrogenase (short-subunit alcohol dehydrogenase family)